MPLKAFQYRLYPNQLQLNLIWKHMNHNRGLYNKLLALSCRYYKIFGKSVSKRKLQDHIVKLKKRPKYAWLKEVNSQSLLATLENLDKAHSIVNIKQKKAPKLSPEGQKVPLVSRPLEPFMLAIATKAQHGGLKLVFFKSS